MNIKTIRFITAFIATNVLSMASLVSVQALELMGCIRPYEPVDGSCQMITTDGTPANSARSNSASGLAHLGGYIHFKGQIQPDDYELIKTKLSQLRQAPFGALAPDIWIESNGGDVNAAMQIGRLLRANLATVVAHGTCASSCIFLLLGGVNRSVIQDGISLSSSNFKNLQPPLVARIGVHRAYRTSVATNETAKDIRAARVALKERVVKYLEEMDIAPELASFMDATPPEEMRFLSKQELVRYRITGRDPSDDERDTALRAQQYKITSAEYRARDVALKSLCQTPSIEARGSKPLSVFLSEYIVCRERVMRTGK
jgi:hypothetical protein